jgi:hypothetical protein
MQPITPAAATMDRIGDHLEVLSLSAAALWACAAAALYLAVPRRLRLQTSLAVMALTLAVSSLIGLGLVASLAKIGSGLCFLLVAIAALQQPGERVRLPWRCWGYVIIGLVSVLYVADTLDSRFAIILRSQWTLLALAALLTARTVVDEQSLRRILGAILAGLSVACVLTFATLLQNPLATFRAGFGRFTPYECNPNQIGVTFAVTTALGLYFSTTMKPSLARAWCMACVAMAFTQSVLTVSRGSFLILAVAGLPSMLAAIRRPVFAIIAAGLTSVVFFYLLGHAESASFDRLDRGLIERTETTLDVIDDMRDRLWLGVGFADDLYAFEGDLNAHNAYVAMLYLGGLSLAAPLILLQLNGHWHMWQAWCARRRLAFTPLLISVMFWLSLALLAHGFVNDMVYYPTYTWAFLHVFVACVSVTMGAAVRGRQQTLQAAQRLSPAWRRKRPAARVRLPVPRLRQVPGRSSFRTQ